jgi:ERCC4-type nuclease
MSIILDTREHGLIPLLPGVPVQQLPVGDALIKHGEETVLVIERKTTADFEASFLDGRYREQRTRLLAFCQTNKARALYILEGGVDGRLRSLTRAATQKLIHRLMLRYGVFVWITRSLEDTATTLNLLADQVREDPKVFVGEQLSYTDVMAPTKKANKDDPRAFALGALQGCPGVSAKSAGAVLDAFQGSLVGIMAADEAALAGVKVGERRVGPAVAKRLYALLHGNVSASE